MMIVRVAKLDGWWTVEVVDESGPMGMSFSSKCEARSYGTKLSKTLKCEFSLIEEAT